MTNILYFKDTQEFLDFNDKIILDNDFIFYTCITFMLSPDIDKVYELYNLLDEDGSNAYCLWYLGNYYIHSFKWNDNILNFLSNKIDFTKYRNYTFTGQRDLLLQLLERNEVTCDILKDRLIYECSATNKVSVVKGKLELANIDDIIELSQMSYQFFVDEYGEKVQNNYEQRNKFVRLSIEHKNLYKLNFEGNICSMAQVMRPEKGNPLIGHLFTKEKERNQGFATSILYQLTNLLLTDGQKKCGLIADIKNVSSNLVFNKVGYKPIYQQISVYKMEIG